MTCMTFIDNTGTVLNTQLISIDAVIMMLWLDAAVSHSNVGGTRPIHINM
jgi:hypothetical protein